MRIYSLDKVCFKVSQQAESFLKGLTSNTLDQPNNAFLTIHGRIIATFDQIQTGEDEYYILIEKPFVDDVLAHLDRYIKLSGAQFKKVNLNVYFDLDNDVPLEEGDLCIEQKQGKLILTERTLEAEVSDEEFTRFRVNNDIPMHGVDYKDEMLLNVTMKDFVSFTKGCFLGQEPLSKVYNRAKPTWRLVVKNKDECSDEEKERMTSKVFDPHSEHEKGFVFEKNE